MEIYTNYTRIKDVLRNTSMYEAEKRALGAIKMSLPDSIKHTFKKYTNSKDMWDALEKRYAGNADVKKNKIDLLKKQFAVFKYMKHESLEDVITRYYHLMSEMENYEIGCYTDVEKNDKLLDALLTKWDIDTLMIKGEADYEIKELEEVVGRLRAYELSMKKKDTGYDQVQDPSVYNCHGPQPRFDPFQEPQDRKSRGIYLNDSGSFRKQDLFNLKLLVLYNIGINPIIYN